MDSQTRLRSMPRVTEHGLIWSFQNLTDSRRWRHRRTWTGIKQVTGIDIKRAGDDSRTRCYGSCQPADVVFFFFFLISTELDVQCRMRMRSITKYLIWYALESAEHSRSWSLTVGRPVHFRHSSSTNWSFTRSTRKGGESRAPPTDPGCFGAFCWNGLLWDATSHLDRSCTGRTRTPSLSEPLELEREKEREKKREREWDIYWLS